MQKECCQSASLKTSWSDLPSNQRSWGLNTLRTCIEEWWREYLTDYKSMNYIHVGWPKALKKLHLLPSRFTVRVSIQFTLRIFLRFLPPARATQGCGLLLRGLQEPIKQRLAARGGGRLGPRFVVPQHGPQHVPHLPALSLQPAGELGRRKGMSHINRNQSHDNKVSSLSFSIRGL